MAVMSRNRLDHLKSNDLRGVRGFSVVPGRPSLVAVLVRIRFCPTARDQDGTQIGIHR